MKRRSVVFRKSHTLARRILSGILSVAIVVGPLPMMGTDGASALPHGGTVTRGGATLAYSTSRLLVNQSTSRASFSWASYNVKSGQSVVYRTPGSSAVSMNFIGGASPATIMGSVRSNGVLEFMDAGGLIFGQGSVVSAAGVMAFGSSTPWGAPTGVVKNAGTITANSGQTVALVGTQVSNSGTITAPGGTIVLVAGATVTPIASTRTSSFSVVTTGGGTVMDSGVLSAETEGGQPGRIVLQSGMDSGTTTLASTAVLDASAPNGGNGGVVLVNGSGVVMNNATPVNVSAPYGTAGTVKIDPNYILSGSTLDICNATGLEDVDKSQTNLTIGTTTTDPLTDTINLEENMNLGGSYSWKRLGNFSTPFTGTFNGNGYTVSGYTIAPSSTSSNYRLGFIGYLGSSGKVENPGVTGNIGTSSTPVTGYCVGGLVGMNVGTITNSYAKGSITSTGSIVGGLVGKNVGTITNSYATGLVTDSGGSSCLIGGFVGFNYKGSITNSYATGLVTDSGGSSSFIGGFVGSNYKGTITNSYAKVCVSGLNYVGGLAGYNNLGTITNSYATGEVVAESGSSGDYMGGLVGYNTGTIALSYSTGEVLGNDNVGGLVGENVGTITNSYATGLVNGTSDFGGLVGDNCSGTYTADYWNTSNKTFTGITYGGVGSGTSTSGTPVTGVNGLSSAGFATSTNFSSWTPTNNAGFNNWSSGAFADSATTYPWFEGKVTYGTGTMNAPMLVGDMPVDTVTGNSGSSVYSGSAVSAGYTTSVTMGGSGSGVAVTPPASSGPNVGVYATTPTVSALSEPTTQTSLASVDVVSGTWTITQAPLTFRGSASPTMTYDGNTSVSLTTSDSRASLSGFVDGQNALYTGATGTFASPNAGTGISVTAILGTGNFASSGTGFAWSNYAVPTMTLSGTGTIAPATLGISTTATKTFDGKAGIVLTPDNSSLTGVVAGQAAGLKIDIPATLSSSSAGSNLGGTVSLDSGDLTGNSAFLSALSAGDYILPTTFTGGRVFSPSSGPVIPAYQVSVSEASLAENSANAGTEREVASLLSFPLPPVANFGSSLGGGLNMGDLTDDSSTIFGLNTESSAVPSKSSDQTIYTIESAYVFPAETQSLNDESAEKTAEPSGPNGEKTSNEGRSRMADTLDSITLAGSKAAPYSLQVPTFNDSVGGVFESQEAR